MLEKMLHGSLQFSQGRTRKHRGGMKKKGHPQREDVSAIEDRKSKRKLDFHHVNLRRMIEVKGHSSSENDMGACWVLEGRACSHQGDQNKKRA